ncbi:MAG: hydrogenase maturation nickel metallochaperone HypA [Nitrospirales bacterium]
MHELGITRSIVSIVTDKLSAVLPEAIRFCFDIVSQGTVAEGAELEIVEIFGTAKCRSCGSQFELEQLCGRCPCGSSDITRLTGEELLVKQMVTA